MQEQFLVWMVDYQDSLHDIISATLSLIAENCNLLESFLLKCKEFSSMKWCWGWLLNCKDDNEVPKKKNPCRSSNIYLPTYDKRRFGYLLGWWLVFCHSQESSTPVSSHSHCLLACKPTEMTGWLLCSDAKPSPGGVLSSHFKNILLNINFQLLLFSWFK